MNEKQFECVFKEHETNNCWSMIKNNQLDKPLYIKDVVALLNELNDESKKLKEENEELKQRIAWFEQQEDEFEEATAQTIQNMIADYKDDE